MRVNKLIAAERCNEQIFWPNVSSISDRNIWVDYLRGFASVWVVIFHLNETIPFEGNVYRQFAKFGWLGVSIFFVISGYCIHLAATRARSSGQFLWRRALRIWPPYLASLLVVFFIAVGVKLATGVNDVTRFPNSAFEWGATLLLMTTPVTPVKTVNWVYWSLSIEVLFYFVIALFLLVRDLAAPLVLLVSLVALLPGISQISGLVFLLHWPIFVMGLGLARLATSERRWGRIHFLVGAIGVTLTQSFSVQVTVFLTTASIWLWDKGYFRLPRISPLIRLGDWSYSLYLLHVPIGCYLLLRWRAGLWIESLTFHVLYDCLVLGCCMAAAAVFYRYVEYPAMVIGRSSPVALLISVKSRGLANDN